MAFYRGIPPHQALMSLIITCLLMLLLGVLGFIQGKRVERAVKEHAANANQQTQLENVNQP